MKLSVLAARIFAKLQTAQVLIRLRFFYFSSLMRFSIRINCIIGELYSWPKNGNALRPLKPTNTPSSHSLAPTSLIFNPFNRARRQAANVTAI